MKSSILRRCGTPLALTLGLLGAGAASAQAAAQSVDFPISGTVTNSCTGDVVTYSGTEHLVTNATVDANGGMHGTAHEDLVDVSGVGTSGDQYRLVGTGNAELNSTSAFESTAVDHIQFVSRGSQPNFAADGTVHITYNANGQITAYVDNLTSEPCRG